MRNYLKIFKKLSDKDFLTKSIVVINIATLRNLNNFVQRLNFECSKILTFQQYLKVRNFEFNDKDDKSLLIINIENEIKMNKCKLSHNQNYEQNHKFLFIIYLHDDKNE